MGARGWKGAAVLLLAGVVGCVPPGMGTKEADEAVAIPPGQGQLVLRWSAEPAGRSLLGSAWAAANAEVYELALVGTGAPRFFDLVAGSGQALAVEPGTYRVVVMAGIKRSSASLTAYLVGSGLAETVTVAEGHRTAVDLVLRSLDLGSAFGKSRNPRLGMSLAGASTTARPRFKSTELWNGYREVDSVTGTPDDWSAAATGTVPDAIPGLTVGLVGASLVVQALDGSWFALAGLSVHSWFWPNRPDIADTHPLATLTEWSATCGPPPTGVEVSLGWE